MVAALTLGSATPHLVRGAGNVPWQVTIGATSALALLSALTIRSVRAGPAGDDRLRRRLVPAAAGVVGWRFTLTLLAVGPLTGTVAMLRLRALPAARRLAHGRR